MTTPIPRRPLPEFVRVRQQFDSRSIQDLRSDTFKKLIASGLKEKIAPGNSIAITAGSRGMGGFVEIICGIVEAVKHVGGRPFIVPAMGSHGGATAAGQTEILRRLGVTEASVGAPVRAAMDTVELAIAENGATAHADVESFHADGIIILGRVKTHPSSANVLASGLLKMMVIGLGKQRGAQEAHNHGLWESVRAVPKVMFEKLKLVCGVAVVENAYRRPCEIEVIDASYASFLEADMRLLRVAKAHLAQIPFDPLDVLVVRELGKTVSGTGMDPNVIGHWRLDGGSHIPDFRRIVALSLTPESLGNGIGIGMVDFTTQRFARNFDPHVTLMNVLTAMSRDSNPREGALPFALSSDREAMEVALYSAVADEDPRICVIKNTAELEELWISTALIEEAKKNSKLQIESAAAPLAFDEAGTLSMYEEAQC